MEPNRALGKGSDDGSKASGWIVKSCGTALGFAPNKMLLPSGVQPVTNSPLGSAVIRRASPPFTVITYTSQFPPTCREKANCEPSGENEGKFSSEGLVVRRFASPPSRPTIQMSPAYENAMLVWLTVRRLKSNGPGAWAA